MPLTLDTTGLFGFDAGHRGGFSPSSSRRDRISLALWSTGLDDSTPLFAGTPRKPVTIVVVWPVCERGLLLDDWKRAWVSSWSLTQEQFARLAELHKDFPLRQHDVWIRGRGDQGIWPCPESLLRHALSLRGDFGQRLEKQIESKRAEVLEGMVK